MRQLDFEELPSRHSLGYAESLCFIRGEIAVFDLRPANVVKSPDGVILPIDSIPVQFDERMVELLST